MTNTALLMRASALVLLVAGAALLFAADEILPRVIPEFPAAAAWLGQVLGSAWLAVAALNWLNKGARLGGIYGRPVVLTNVVLYFISGMALLKVAVLPAAPAVVIASAFVCVAFAGLYGWLMFRG
jgi:hypothetical protein